MGGCIPIPYKDPYSPEVIGTLAQEGRPEKNSLVTLSLGDTCDDPVLDTRTNEEGQFHFDPVHKLQLVHWIMAHKIYRWSVCFSLPDGKIGAWHGSHYGIVGVRAPVHLECNSALGLICKAQETFLLKNSSEIIG